VARRRGRAAEYDRGGHVVRVRLAFDVILGEIAWGF
jgi:hypothetical protein